MWPGRSRLPGPSWPLTQGSPHLSRHVVADRHDGRVAQLQDAEHLAAHDGQRPPGHENRPPQHVLQEALGHCGGHHGKTVRESGREEG